MKMLRDTLIGIGAFVLVVYLIIAGVAVLFPFSLIDRTLEWTPMGPISSEQDQFEVSVEVGCPDEMPEVRVDVDESPSEIRVKVSMDNVASEGDCLMGATPTVQLSEPIGDRVVVDVSNGREYRFGP